MTSRFVKWLWLPALVFVLCLGGVLILFMDNRYDDLRESGLFASARTHHQTLSGFRKYYTEEIVGRLAGSGIRISHDYRQFKHAIPLPATMSIELSDMLPSTDSSATYRLYSQYPFEWRHDRQLDGFQQEAIAAISQGQREFGRFTRSDNGQQQLRLAVPVFMEQGCVGCHNSHDSSPRKNWQAGDLRGIQEVILPAPPLSPETIQTRNLLIAAVVGVVGIIIILLTQLARRHARAQEQTETLRINERNKARALSAAVKSLTLERRQMSALIDNAVDGILQLDHDGYIRRCNPSASRLLARADTALIGQSFDHILHQGPKPADVPETETSRRALWITRPDGSIVPVELAINQIEGFETGDLSETALGAVVYIRDLTQKISNERALMHSRSRLLAMVEASLDAIIGINEEGKLVEYNPAAESIFGYSREEALGSSMADLIVPVDFRDAHNAGMQRYQKTGEAVVLGQRLELPAMRKDGSRFDAEITIERARTDAGAIFIGYVRDISERKASEQALIDAKNAAEAASEAKDSFLAIMSHEIRTPLNGVSGILWLLGKELQNSPHHHLITTAKESAGFLSAIINDILDFSKLEAGKLTLDKEPFDLTALVQSTVDLMTTEARRKGLFLHTNFTPGAPGWYEGDPGRIRQILLNLVGNALKFTEQGGVTITVDTQNPATIAIAVKDSGIGISEDGKARIFEEFTTLDASSRRRQGGTGLGLAISKNLASLMDGDILIDSIPGNGSCFTVTLPLHPVAQPAETVFQGDSSDTDIPESTILIVDDNPTNLMVLAAMLEKMGHQVTQAESGVEALPHAVENRYDLILMDVMMPGMDGIECMKAIRAGGACKDSPVIATTALAMQGDEERLLKLGMDGYLPKPFKSEQLRSVLATWLPRQQQAAQPSPAMTQDAPAQTDTQGMDPSVLDRMQEDTGPDILPTLITVFIKEADERTTACHAYADSNNLQKWLEEAHTLGSSAGAFGAMELHKTARMVEEALRRQDIDLAREHTARLIPLWQESRDGYQAYLDALSGAE